MASSRTSFLQRVRGNTDILHLPIDFYDAYPLEVDAVLGVGATSKVFRASCTDDSDEKCAVKKLCLKKIHGEGDRLKRRVLSCARTWRLFQNEVSILERINHPNIVSVVLAAACPGYLAISMEYCPKGTLRNRVNESTTEDVDRYFAGLVSALRYLHDRRIVHGDISLRNVFLDGLDEPILGDFGLSYIMPDDCKRVHMADASRGYTAPEMKSNARRIDPFKCDVFALGVTIRCLILKKLPDEEKKYHREIERLDDINDKYRFFLQVMLRKSPRKRFNMELIHDALRSY